MLNRISMASETRRLQKMRSIKRIIATILFLAVLFVSVNAEGTYDLYFNASLDLATGETTYTPMELDESNDSSDLCVEITKITPDGTATAHYFLMKK